MVAGALSHLHWSDHLSFPRRSEVGSVLWARLRADPLHLFQEFEDFPVFLAVDPRLVPAKRASRDAAEYSLWCAGEALRQSALQPCPGDGTLGDGTVGGRSGQRRTLKWL